MDRVLTGKENSMDWLNLLTTRYPALLPLQDRIQNTYEILLETAKTGGKILLCGNGGSASDAEHVVGELMKEFHRKRPVDSEFEAKLREMDDHPEELLCGLQGAIPAISLNSQTSLLTALCNDGDPSLAFAQQVYGYGRKGDTLLAFSTSGNSANVWNAVRVARAKGIKVILISGESGGEIAPLADAALCLPESDTYLVQELTLPIYHTLCLMLEDAVFGKE